MAGRDPSAAGGGRQVGEAAGRSGSDEIKAGLGSSLMPISRHVLSTSRLDAPGSREGAAQAGGSVPALEQAACGVHGHPQGP